MAKRGIYWIATGANYLEEAIFSRNQYERTKMDLPTAIATDQPDPGGFDYYIHIPDRGKRYGVQIPNLALSPFEETLNIDTDAYILTETGELFTLLSKYDICCRLAPKRTVPVTDLPHCFPELHAGVILYKKSSKFNDFLNKWQSLYDSLGLVENMPSFSYALHTSNMNLGILPPEYNYELFMPEHAYGEVKILHGRLPDVGLQQNHSDLSELVSRLNNYEHHRLTSKSHVNGFKFEYVQVRGNRNLMHQFLLSLKYNGAIYTFFETVRHIKLMFLNR
jgi:hypothetical protein